MLQGEGDKQSKRKYGVVVKQHCTWIVLWQANKFSDNSTINIPEQVSSKTYKFKSIKQQYLPKYIDGRIGSKQIHKNSVPGDILIK